MWPHMRGMGGSAQSTVSLMTHGRARGRLHILSCILSSLTLLPTTELPPRLAHIHVWTRLNYVSFPFLARRPVIGTSIHTCISSTVFDCEYCEVVNCSALSVSSATQSVLARNRTVKPHAPRVVVIVLGVRCAPTHLFTRHDAADRSLALPRRALRLGAVALPPGWRTVRRAA